MRRARSIGHFRLSPAGDPLGKEGAPPPEVEAARAWVRTPEAAAGPSSLERAWGEGGQGHARMVVVPARGPDGAVSHFDVFVEEAGPAGDAPGEPGRSFLESILEALPNPVFVKDEQHRWVLLNDATCRFMGHERSQLLGKSDHDFFPKAEADVFWAKDDAVFATGQVNENEESFTDAAGRAHVILTRKSLHTDAHGRRYLVGVITDITERKQMEDELRRSRDELDRRVAERTAELLRLNAQLQDEDRRKTEFLAILGHELRNPLTPIRNAVYALQRLGPASGPQERPRAIIERQVTQMARLIDDLLDVSRIARGKVLLRESRFDVVQVVRSAVDDRADVLQAGGLTVETRLPEGARMMVGDPARLAQAVGNLLDNAHKFTDPGGRIGVELRTEGGGSGVAITVRDTGMGMTAEMREHLFEPFAQAAVSLRRGGLGLGLALVKGLVELHGGSVSASSPGPGLGSEFTIRLPLSGGEAEAQAPEAVRPRAGHRVLVVEDSEDAAESLGLALQMAGHEVALASSGPQGLETASRFRPDVVLSDIGLGAGMSGYDLARAMRASPDLRGVRLVAVTGYGQEEDRRRALEAGFDAHLVKPFEVDALCRLIERLVGSPGAAGRGTEGAGGRT